MNTTIKIQNLKCGGCVKTITKNLNTLQGIKNVLVHLENSTVTFDFESEDQLENVRNKLASLGYPQEGEKNSLKEKTKSFVSCTTGKISI